MRSTVALILWEAEFKTMEMSHTRSRSDGAVLNTDTNVLSRSGY